MWLAWIGRAPRHLRHKRHDLVTVSFYGPGYVIEGLRALEPHGGHGARRHFFQQQFRLHERERADVARDIEKVMIFAHGALFGNGVGKTMIDSRPIAIYTLDQLVMI